MLNPLEFEVKEGVYEVKHSHRPEGYEQGYSEDHFEFWCFDFVDESIYLVGEEG